MERNDKLVRDTFRGILVVNIVSMVSAIAAVMIDAIVTGQFLGSDAVASMGLIQPVVMIFNLLGTLFGPGLIIVCTRYMGMAKIDKVIQAFSLTIIVMLGVSVISAVSLFLLAPALGNLIGAGTKDPTIIKMISDYLRGFSIGLPFMVLSMGLSGLMMLDNDRKLSVIAIFVTLFSDAIFDFLNVLVFHGGMGGMALATSFSTILGFLILLTHFLKKERILRFRPSGMRISDLKEVILNSIPNVIASGSSAIRNLIFNVLLLAIATKVEVSALSVTNSTFSIVIAVALALSISTSTLVSLFYGEEDKRGIEVAFKQSAKVSLILFAVVTVIFLVFANFIARLFLKSGDASTFQTAAFFIRCMVIQFFLMCVSFSLSGVYQGTRNMKMNYLTVIFRETVLPVVSVIVLGLLFGIKGVGIGFIVSGALCLLVSVLMPTIAKRKLPTKAEDFVLLPEHFGPRPEDTFEASVSDMDGVIEASTKVGEFYKEHGIDKRTTLFVSLFLEEMLRNTIEHGYKFNRSKNADIRVICTPQRQIIRIRDNGDPFDPMEWYKRNNPEEPSSAIGIRMVVALAKDVQYVPAMNLNNIILML